MTGGRHAPSLGTWAAAGWAALDPTAVVLTSWWLAFAAIAVLQQAHVGLHEHNELPPLLHLVRDASLAVPSAALAVIAASLLLGDRLRRSTAVVRGGVSDFDRLRWVLLAAGLFAILSIPGNQLHSVLFGAEEEEVGWLADATLDAAIALIGALLALFPLAIVVGPPVRRPHATGPAGPSATDDQTDPPTVLTSRSTR